jgi:hypothetical protein
LGFCFFCFLTVCLLFFITLRERIMRSPTFVSVNGLRSHFISFTVSLKTCSALFIFSLFNSTLQYKFSFFLNLLTFQTPINIFINICKNNIKSIYNY